MTHDLLSRDAVERKLLRDALERTRGRELVGLKFKKDGWYVVLEDGVEQLVRLASEVLNPAVVLNIPNPPRTKARLKPPRLRARKKK